MKLLKGKNVIVTGGSLGIGNTSAGSMHANANKLVVGTGSGNQGMSVFAGTSTGMYAFARAVGNNTDTFGGDYNNIIFASNSQLEKWPVLSKKEVASKLAMKVNNFFRNDNVKNKI